MTKKALKRKEKTGNQSRSRKVLPGIEVTKEHLEVERWLADDVENLSSRVFSSEEEAIECLIRHIGARFSYDSEDFTLFITELIESDPALRSDIFSVLKIQGK